MVLHGTFMKYFCWKPFSSLINFVLVLDELLQICMTLLSFTRIWSPRTSFWSLLSILRFRISRYECRYWGNIPLGTCGVQDSQLVTNFILGEDTMYCSWLAIIFSGTYTMACTYTAVTWTQYYAMACLAFEHVMYSVYVGSWWRQWEVAVAVFHAR